MIEIDLRKQHALDAYPKAIQQTNFTGNLDQAEGVFVFFAFSKKQKKVFWTFHKELWEYCKCVVQ